MTYVALNGLIYLTTLISRGRIEPRDIDLQEYWTWKPRGGHAPWFIRVASGGGRHWTEQRDEKEDTALETTHVELDRLRIGERGGSGGGR